MTSEPARTAMRELANGPNEMASIDAMTVSELAAKYHEVYGEPTRSRNKGYLRKRVAWRMQALVSGGLTRRALDKISQLGDVMPERWVMRESAAQPNHTAPTVMNRDPRLPAPGTMLTRVHRGIEHRVTVLADGFEYEGTRFKTLSGIAKHITGTPWNGLAFFGLNARTETTTEERAA